VWTYCREELERKNGVTGANQERRRFCFKAHLTIRVWNEDKRLGELFYCFSDCNRIIVQCLES